MKITKIVLALSLVANSLYAMQHTVSLAEAIKIALTNNEKLKVSQTSIEISQTMYNQAMSANYPTLDVSMTAMRMDEPSTFSMRGTTTIDNSHRIDMNNALSGAATADGNMYTAATYAGMAAATPTTSELPIVMDVQMAGRDSVLSKVSSTLPLYTGGKISAIIEQASLGQKIAQESKRRTQNEVIFDVKRYYYGVILSKQLKQLSEDTLIRMGVIRDLTSRLYQGGSMNVKKTDYLRTKLSVNLLESLHEEISQKEIMAKSALLFAMGLPWKDNVEITQKEIRTPIMNETLETLVNDAYHFNPDYSTLKLAINVHNAKIDEAKSEYLPSVGAFASAQNIYNDYEYGLVNDTNKNSWTIGVGVEWSLFNGMRTTNQVQQNRLEKLRLEQHEVLLQEGLALQIKQEFLKMKSAHKQYVILNEATQTAQESRSLNTRAYQEDMVSTKDVIESQLFESYTTAAYYKSFHDHALALAQADFIVGKSIEDAIKK